MMIDFLNRQYAGSYPPGRARSHFDWITISRTNVPLE